MGLLSAHPSSPNAHNPPPKFDLAGYPVFPSLYWKDVGHVRNLRPVHKHRSRSPRRSRSLHIGATPNTVSVARGPAVPVTSAPLVGHPPGEPEPRPNDSCLGKNKK